MMQLCVAPDPVRLPERLFGGPYGTACWWDGEFFYSMDATKRWTNEDLQKAWMKGKACPVESRKNGGRWFEVFK